MCRLPEAKYPVRPALSNRVGRVFLCFPSYGPDHTSLGQEQKRNPRLQFLEVLISGWKKRDFPYPGLVSANPPLEARNNQNGFRSLVPSVNWAQGRRKDSADSGPYRGSQFTVAVRVLVRAQNPDPDGPLGVPWGWIGDDKCFPATTFRFDFGSEITLRETRTCYNHQYDTVN